MNEQIYSLGYNGRRSKNSRRRRWPVMVAVSTMAVLLGGSTWIRHTEKQLPTPEPRTLHVMFVGGSIAKGEHAPNDYGYLQRTFHSLTVQTGTHYAYTNKSIIGANSTQLATMYKGSYQSWLDQVKPQIVVLSWGLLNDALPHTPMSAFQHYLKQEIDDALKRHAVVMVVTPPVTESTYTKFPTQEQRYATGEIQLVSKLHSPNVYAFNLFDQMKRYLVAHNQTIVPYTADPNHPNAAGHRLAARLLYQDIVRRFGNRPIAD